MVWRARSLRHAEPPLGLVPDWLGWVSAFHLNVSGFSVVSTPLLVSLGREVFEVFVVQRLRLRYGFPRTSFLFTFPPHFLGGCRPCFLFFSLVCCVHNFWGFILYTFRYFTFCPFDGKFYSFSFLFFFFLRSRGCDEVRKFAKAHFIGVIAGRTIVFTAPVSCLSHRTRLELL